MATPKQIKELIKVVEQMAKKFDFSFEVEYDNDKFDYIWLQKTTDSGEDWIINLNDVYSLSDLKQELYDQYYSFEVDSDVETQLQCRGNPGAEACLENAKDKLKTLNDMSVWVNQKIRSLEAKAANKKK